MLPDEEEGGNQNNVEPEMEENQEEFQDADTLVDENSEDKEGPEEPDLEETRNNPTNAWMSSPQQRGEPSNFSVRFTISILQLQYFAPYFKTSF